MAGLLDALFSGSQGGGLLEFLQSLQQPQQSSFSGLPSDQAQYGAGPQYGQPMDAMARMPSRRAAPVPLPEMPQQAAPQQQPAPMQAPQQQLPQVGDSYMDRINSGGSLMGSLFGGDPAQRIAQQNQNAQFRAFQEAGLTPSQAMIAVSNPKLAEKLMEKLSPTYSAHNVGNTALVFNPATGTMQPAYTEPKYEKLGPGENLISVGGGGKTNTIASGGPQKPPAEYMWNDPSGDPSKGMTAIEGSAATRLPEGSAGRMALMEVAQKALPSAREVLMKDRGDLGLLGLRATGNPGIQSVVGTGEVGRAQRSIRLAVEAALRASTGQAAPETEVVRYADMFTPTAMDSRETAAQKFNQLEDFMVSHKELATRGRGGKANSGVPSDPLGIR